MRSRLLAGVAVVFLVALSAVAAEPAQRNAARSEKTKSGGTVAAMGQQLQPTRKVVYKTVGDRQLQLHLFEPPGFKPSDKRPVFIAIHGGGWQGGDAQRFYAFADHFARLGMLGISPEYRLIDAKAGTTPFECVKDGRSIVRYVRAHAAELGADPQKIVVSGGSAGGHVAAATALFDGIDEPGEDTSVSCVPNALVLYFPVIDTSTEGYGNKKIGERWAEISPLHRVKAGLPPTLVLHGTADTTTPFKGAKAFHEAMLKAGNRCELIVQEGGKHGYLMFDREAFDRSMQQTQSFLEAVGVLKPAAK